MSLLANPLATVQQLSASRSQDDGIPAHLERSVHFAGAQLTQAAGILLRLPQDVIATAIVLFTRAWVGSEGASLIEFGAKDISAASLYLSSKQSAYPKSPRSILNVYAWLDAQKPSFLIHSSTSNNTTTDPDSYYLSEGTYQTHRLTLFKTETRLLRTLGFQTHVALPHTLCINYLQALDVFFSSPPAPASASAPAAPASSSTSTHPDSTTATTTNKGSLLAKRAIAHLNTALLSPQRLYLTHQPAQLATAAIYLAAREVNVKLPEGEWWEVFDTDRETLGFLVVGLRSMEGFVRGERERWGGTEREEGEGKGEDGKGGLLRMPPLSVDGVLEEMKGRR